VRIPAVYILKEWSGDRARIRHRIFLKSEVYFGSDQKADVKIEGLGLVARLNFRDGEYENFETRKLNSLKESELLVLGSKVFCWQKWCMKTLSLLWASALVLILISSFLFSRYRGCEGESWDAESQESANKIQSMIESKNLVQARSQINELSKRSEGQACRPTELQQLELSLAEAYIIEKLYLREYLKAAQYLAQASAKLKTQDLEPLRAQILAGAQQVFWRAWSLERKSPGESYRLQKEAQSICQVLGLQQTCFLRPAGASSSL
jgi:hypothetical protein